MPFYCYMESGAGELRVVIGVSEWVDRKMTALLKITSSLLCSVVHSDMIVKMQVGFQECEIVQREVGHE